MRDKNCFFFPSSLFKIIYIATAMKGFLTANKKKIIQFFYQSFLNAFGITDEGDANSDSHFFKSAQWNPPYPNVRIPTFLRVVIILIPK
jgi:hypothetical protein